jgi:hypothetical protein
MGAERKSQFIDQKNKLATAYHEVWFEVPSATTLLTFRKR